MGRRKNTRAGGKFTPSHTTVLDLSGKVVDIIKLIPEVTGISLSVISPTNKSGKSRVKIISQKPCGIILMVRQGCSCQQLLLQVKEVGSATLKVAKTLRNHKIPICFGKSASE